VNYLDGFFWYDESLIGDSPTFVEIGSRTGQVAKELIKRHPSSQVIVYEASRDNYKHLVKETSHLPVIAHNEAVIGHDGTVTFHEYENWESNSVLARHKVQSHRRLKKQYTVAATSLSTMLEVSPSDTIDALFTNCEGAELNIAKELLQRGHVRERIGQLCISFHGRIFGQEKVDSMLNRLSEHYRIVRDPREGKYDCVLLILK